LRTELEYPRQRTVDDARGRDGDELGSRQQAGLKRDTADTGAVTLIQRFGSAANLMKQP
jgi:hypothetical protein